MTRIRGALVKRVHNSLAFSGKFVNVQHVHRCGTSLPECDHVRRRCTQEHQRNQFACYANTRIYAAAWNKCARLRCLRPISTVVYPVRKHTCTQATIKRRKSLYFFTGYDSLRDQVRFDCNLLYTMARAKSTAELTCCLCPCQCHRCFWSSNPAQPRILWLY